MIPKRDRRPERTRKALLSAFVDLILERGYASLTVGDVAEKANIGRSTLYLHFGGLEGLLKQSLKTPSSRLAALVDQPATPSDLAGLLSHFKDQRRRNGMFFTPPIRALWVRALADLIEPRLVELARTQERAIPGLPWSLVATQLAEGQIALVANWLTLRVTASPEAVAAALIATTRATIDSLVPAAADRRAP